MSGYGQQSYQPQYGSKMQFGGSQAAYGSTGDPYQGYQGQTKPAMLDGSGFQRYGMGSLKPWWLQDQKAYTPPPGGAQFPNGTPPPPITPPTLPPISQPPGAPPTTPPTGQPPVNRPGDFGPLPPGSQPPGQPNPAQFPGVPQHLLSAITTDPSGRMLYGPDKQPVKFQGGKMVFDSTPFVPGQGQFGQFGAPGAGGFTLDQSSGRNMILGGANGPQMYNAEGLVQGSQAPQNFVNYLNSYRR